MTAASAVGVPSAFADEEGGRVSTGAAALCSGIIAGLAARRGLSVSHAVGLPATASTLVTVGGAGLLGGLIGAVLAPLSSV